MNRLTYAVIPDPGNWPDALQNGTIHKHATDNGARTLADGRLFIEIPARAITVAEKTYQGTTFNVVQLPPAVEALIDVVRTHARQLYVQAIDAAQAMQDGVAGPDGTPQSQADLEALLDGLGVDHSGFTTPVQYRVAYARSGDGPDGEPNARLGPPNWTPAQFSAWGASKSVGELAAYCWEAEIDVHNVDPEDPAALRQRIGEETGYLPHP